MSPALAFAGDGQQAEFKSPPTLFTDAPPPHLFKPLFLAFPFFLLFSFTIFAYIQTKIPMDARRSSRLGGKHVATSFPLPSSEVSHPFSPFSLALLFSFAIGSDNPTPGWEGNEEREGKKAQGPTSPSN
jgi:hypothetical protein